MANTVIQLKYSTINSTPTTLNVGEPAYSYTSNTLFIGSPAGTGSIAIGRNADGTMIRSGGWGPHFGDEGSGFWIGCGVMRGYAEGARLEWVGGPLNGSYSSLEAIRGTWSKFSTAQGPLKLHVDKLEEAGNPQGSTVSANLLFEGKSPIKVRHVLTFRDSRIVSETWQIDPKLTVTTAGY